MYFVRYAAVVGGTISIFLSLHVAGTRQETDLVDWVVSLSAVAMFFAMSFMNGIVMGGEHSGFGSLFKRENKTDAAPAKEGREPVVD